MIYYVFFNVPMYFIFSKILVFYFQNKYVNLN